MRTRFWPHNTSLFVKDFKGNDPRFVAYLLRSMPLAKMNSGAAQPSLNRNFLYPLQTRIPDPPEQYRIASILGAFDDLIEVNRRRIAVLEEMARRLFEEWFVHFRFPGHDARKSDAQPVPPAAWKLSRLADLCTLISRGIAPTYDEAAPALVIGQKCVREQKLSLAAARRQRKNVPAEKLVRPGDVLINSTGVGTLGRVAQVEEIPDGTTVDTHVTIVRSAPGIDHDYFGMALIRLEGLFERLGAGATGQTELNRSRIGDVEILLPDRPAQASFGKHIRPVRSLTYTLARQCIRLASSRDLLLPRLISGDLSVTAAARQLEAVA